MAKAWKDVIASQQYQALSPEQRSQAQEQYFNEVVAPKAGDNAAAAKEQFYSAYPPSVDQNQSTMWQEPPTTKAGSESWGDQQPRTNAEALGDAIVDVVGKGGLQAATGVLNIPAEIADAFTSAGAWAGGKMGLGDGTYQPAPRITLPESLKPITSGGKITGEVLPYLLPTGLEKAGIQSAQGIEKLGTKAAQILRENVPGALAQSSSGQQDDLAGNLATGAAGSAAARVLTGAMGKVAGPLVKSAREWLSPTEKVVRDAVAQRITSASATAQNEAAQLVGKAVGQSAGKTNYSALAEEIRPQDSILRAAKELDMEGALLPSHYSQSQTYRAIEQGLKSVPASQLKAKEYETINQLAQKADDMIGLAGGTTNKVGLSDKFKHESLRTIDELSKKSDSIYDEISKAIPVRQQINPYNTVSMLKEKAKNLGGVGNLSKPERMVLSKLISGTPTYGLIDNLRKQIGAAINKNQGPFKDQTTGELKQLYSTVTSDQGVVANKFGVGDKWGVAKELVSQRKQLEDHMVVALGKDLNGSLFAKVAPAIQGLRKGNVHSFDKIIAATPPHMRQEVVASALNDIFTLGSRKQNQLHIPGFVDWYEGAKKSGALNRVMKELPAYSRRNLSNIYKVSAGIRRANEEAISTGRLGTLIKAIDGKRGVLANLHGITEKGAAVGGGSLGATVGTIIGGPIGGSVGGALGAGAGGALANASGRALARPARSVTADRLLADPSFQKALMKANEKNQESVNRVIQRIPAWREFVGNLSGDEARQIQRVGVIGWLNGQAGE